MVPEAETAAFNDGCPLESHNILKLTFQWMKMQAFFSVVLLDQKKQYDPLHHGYLYSFKIIK